MSQHARRVLILMTFGDRLRRADERTDERTDDRTIRVTVLCNHHTFVRVIIHTTERANERDTASLDIDSFIEHVPGIKGST